MSVELATREPSSLVEVHDQCQAVEAWAEECDSIPAIQDVSNRLAAMDEYLLRTSKDGRARVAAAMRRLELRIGDLLPCEQGRRTDLEPPYHGKEVKLNERQRAEFRRFAANRDIVEATIAGADDKAPPTRRAVILAIVKQDKAKAVELRATGLGQREIAARLGVAQSAVCNWLNEASAPEPRSDYHRGSHFIKADRVVEQTFYALDGLAMGIKQVDVRHLDPAYAGEWANHLRGTLRPIQEFIRALDRRNKEQA